MKIAVGEIRGFSARTRNGFAHFLGSIRARLFIFFLIAISPLALFQAQTLRDARSDRINEARSVAAAEAELGAAAYREALDRARTVLALVSRTPPVATGDGPTCGAYLRGVDASRDIAGDIRVLDTDGRVICASDERLVGRRMSLSRASSGQEEDTRFAVEGFSIDDAGQPVSFVSLAGPGEKLYVAAIDAGWFRRFAVELSERRSAKVLLASASGTPLIVFGESRIGAPGDAIAGSASLPGDGASVVVSSDLASVLADIDRLALRGYTILIALLLLVALTGYVVGRRLLLAPIDDLRQIADSFASGDFTARAVSDRFNARSEFAVLASAFNGMASALEDRKVALDAAQARLDAKEAELVAANLRLEALAHSDPLTGLANRRRFDESLEEAWERMAGDGEPMAVVAIDIDHFKLYNDNYGHPAGDRCLKQVADALAIAALRSEDLVARCGGEEFAVLLPGLPPEHLGVVAEIVRTQVFDRVLERADTPLGRVTVSVGAALVYPCRGGSPEALRIAADRALYEAKNGGRNRCVVHVDPPPEIDDARLRVAL
ncbi:MAG: diguanylate cyclase [Salinarimonadaceae bacterium]|nr:MAG: diguanylate cyclase [Salinarimonadaceae bacterium]